MLHPAQTKAKGNGGLQTGGTLDLVDLLQQGEFAFNGPVHIPLFKDKEETVPLHTAQKAVVLLRPGGNNGISNDYKIDLLNMYLRDLWQETLCDLGGKYAIWSRYPLYPIMN